MWSVHIVMFKELTRGKTGGGGEAKWMLSKAANPLLPTSRNLQFPCLVANGSFCYSTPFYHGKTVNPVSARFLGHTLIQETPMNCITGCWSHPVQCDWIFQTNTQLQFSYNDVKKDLWKYVRYLHPPLYSLIFLSAFYVQGTVPVLELKETIGHDGMLPTWGWNFLWDLQT